VMGSSYCERVRAPVTGAAGGDGDFLHAQVPGHGPVPARPDQRGGRFAFGVAELLGVDVVLGVSDAGCCLGRRECVMTMIE